MPNNRLSDNLLRDLFVFDDENNPKSSQISRIYPPTILDQVFDHLHPTQKNLREILADLRYEIITGGLGNIEFPVTTVNGKSGDVTVTSNDVGLGRVDNTSDIDKPLSVPQRSAVMDILSVYNFNINLDPLYEHLKDTTNPHSVSVDDLNLNDKLVKFADARVGLHNLSTSSNTHPDIRRLLSTLWDRVDEIDFGSSSGGSSGGSGSVASDLDGHIKDKMAHFDLFEGRENTNNKAMIFTATIDNNHTMYPTTRAVSDFITDRLVAFKDTLPKINEWISNIQVIDNQSELPVASSDNYRHAYIITRGPDPFEIESAIAVCRRDPSDIYFWDIKGTENVSIFDPKYFKKTVNGLSLDIPAILDTDPDDGEETVSFYDVFLRSVQILPGTMDGHIRYSVNNDPSTMSDDVKIPGLNSLAYREWITENEIKELAVHEKHILNKAVTTRTIDDRAVIAPKISCAKGKIIGNLVNSTSTAHEITLEELADALRSLI